MEIKPFIYKSPIPDERTLKHWDMIMPRPTIPCPWKPGDTLYAFNGRKVVCAGIQWGPVMRRPDDPDDLPYFWTWWIETHGADAINDYNQVGQGVAWSYTRRKEEA